MLRADHGVLLCTAALLAVGMLTVSSADFELGTAATRSPADVLLGRDGLLAMAALTAGLLAWRLPSPALLRLRGAADPSAWGLLAAILLLLAVLVPSLGVTSKGSLRWLELGPIRFQPSEVAKWALPVFLAVFASRRAGAMGRFGAGLLPPLLVVGLVGGLIAHADLGTAVLVVTVGGLVLLAAGARLAHFAPAVPVGAAGFTAAVLLEPYRLERLRAFGEPFADPAGTGYQLVQSLGAIAGGGISGRGLGNGVQKFAYLPDDTTDFVFAIVCEEMGMVGATLVVGLIALLLACLASIATRADGPAERLVAFGVLATLGLQSLINLFVVTGMAPTKGIALPLVSRGGTGWILTAGMLGLVAAIGRRAALAEAAGDSLPARDEPGPEPAGAPA